MINYVLSTFVKKKNSSRLKFRDIGDENPVNSNAFKIHRRKHSAAIENKKKSHEKKIVDFILDFLIFSFKRIYKYIYYFKIIAFLLQ